TPSHSPTPSPSLPTVLSTILAPTPGSGWVEAQTNAPGVFEGPFTAKQYVGLSSSADAAAAQSTLEHDGFVAGYGRTWVLSSSQHALVEAVIAFSGGAGAKSWLAASELADKADPTYKGPLTLTGVSNYYGVKLFNPTTKIYVAAFAFVKGNDFFIVGTASTVGDKGAAATTQANAQYKAAPENTIPVSKWPESASQAPARGIGSLLGDLVILVLVVGVLLLVAGLVLRARRSSSAQRRPQQAPSAALPGESVGIVQLSPDGNFWWDGQAWKNATFEVPPTAQRSPDGGFWWDGETWRAVPVTRPPS
ncbi:MAG: hypothetical protein ACHQ0J_08615, partial [Candidatus Dormibacterales bacterium]